MDAGKGLLGKWRQLGYEIQNALKI